MDTIKKRKLNVLDLVWIVLFFLGFALITYKCKFGFAGTDETFYLSIPKRLADGDVLFKHEWSTPGMSALLILPFYKMYSFFANSTDGIILVFRYIFVFLHSVVAIWLYFKLRKRTVAAIAISLIYLLFVPWNIAALSYKSCGVALVLITCTIFFTNDKGKFYLWIIAGIMFSCAVLCCPYLIFAYIIYAIAAILLYFIKGKKENFYNEVIQCNYLKITSFLFFSLGCTVSATIFFVYIFSQMSINSFFESLSLIFKFLSSERKVTFFEKALEYFRHIIRSNFLVPYIFIVSVILSIVVLIDRKSNERKLLYFFAAYFMSSVYLLFLMRSYSINLIMFPLNILGFFCFLLYPRKNVKPFLCFWLPGILYSFCLDYASNTEFYAISEATLVSMVGTIIMVVAFCRNYIELSDNKMHLRNTLCKVSVFALICCFILAEAYIRCPLGFGDYTEIVKKGTEQITVGAEKGIMVAPEKKEEYEKIYYDTQPVREYDGKTVCYYVLFPSLYIEDEKEVGSFSTWVVAEKDVTFQKAIKYYSINEDKIPDIAYILKPENASDMIGWTKQKEIDYTKISNYFEELGYIKTETDMGYYYTKPSNFRGERDDTI